MLLVAEEKKAVFGVEEKRLVKEEVGKAIFAVEERAVLGEEWVKTDVETEGLAKEGLPNF